MLSKTEIFKDIVHILKNDYSGHEEKAAVNNPNSISITDDMSDVEFLKEMQRYIFAFNDGHLSFTSNNIQLPFRGFQVCRFKDTLYVTKITGENRLEVGDQIIAINNESIQQAESRYNIYLQSDVHERQLWHNVLPFAKTITFIRNNETETITLNSYERPAYTPEYSFKQLDEQTGYIKLTDFTQGEPILRLVQENEQAIEKLSTIIFDVRINKGGNDMFYFPLVPYVIDTFISTLDLGEPDEYMYTNYTARNCDLWIKSLEEYLTQPLDDETRFMLEQEIEKYRINYGKGFQRIEDSLEVKFEPKGNAKQIYILTDITCGSSGETFVKNLRLSPKVKVVGRGTMGILDYCNVTTKSYGDFQLNYSISKLNPKYYKNDTGEVPDIHIPWTPQHLIEDVNLNYVLSLCNLIVTEKQSITTEAIHIDMPVKTFNMANSNNWTEEQWAIWRGDDRNYDKGWNLSLMQDEQLSIKILSTSHNEISRKQCFTFELTNYSTKPIAFQFTRGGMDGHDHELKNKPFIVVHPNEPILYNYKFVPYQSPLWWEQAVIELNAVNAITFEKIRSFHFHIEKSAIEQF